MDNFGLLLENDPRWSSRGVESPAPVDPHSWTIPAAAPCHHPSPKPPSQQGQALQYHPACCLPWLPKRQSHSPSGTKPSTSGELSACGPDKAQAKSQGSWREHRLAQPAASPARKRQVGIAGGHIPSQDPVHIRHVGRDKRPTDRQTMTFTPSATTLGRITSISKPLFPPPAARTRPPRVSLSDSIKRQPRPGGRSWIKCSRVVTPPLVPVTACTQCRVNSGWMARRPAQK